MGTEKKTSGETILEMFSPENVSKKMHEEEERIKKATTGAPHPKKGEYMEEVPND